MNVKRRLLRIIATILGFTGLTCPVCAMVCPKGIGSCPCPGRCFLYTDADGDYICDYTSPSAGSGETSSSPATPTGLSDPAPAGIFGTLTMSAVVTGIILCIVMTVALFRAIRSGRIGIRNAERGPALALSLLVSLGIAEIAIYLLTDSIRYATFFALLYILAGTILSAYLWKSHAMNRRIVILVAGVSTVAGFVFAAPIMPGEFNGIVDIMMGQQTLTPAILGIGAICVITLLAGRVFCSHICPVGSIQELAYAVPGRKILVLRNRALELVRLGVFIAAVAAAVYAINLLEYTGLYDFFALTISIGFLVTAVLLVISIFIYRPICRALCPFGLIFSVISHFGLSRLRRTDACTGCGKCEKVCPVGAAGDGSSRRECYMCGRCVDLCPVDAIRLR